MIGRFVVRDGLFFGSMTKTAMENGTIKSDTVYEISEYDGEFSIKEVGTSIIPKNIHDDIEGKTFEYGTWGSKIGDLMEFAGNKILLSVDEYNTTRKIK